MIWCVEDDASIRDIEVYALTSTGFEAKGFEDGNSFWNALQAEIPELVVLDVMLPGQDGISLLKRMKQTKEFRDIPVVMATAKGSEYDKIQGLDLGADDYLVKPFGIMEMVTREQLLGSVWNTDYVGETRTVDMHIRTLRQKLGVYGCFIETVRNVGYRLETKHDK